MMIKLVLKVFAACTVMAAAITPFKRPIPQIEEKSMYKSIDFEKWLHEPIENTWDSIIWLEFCKWAEHDPSIYNRDIESIMLDVWMETNEYEEFLDSIDIKRLLTVCF